MPSPTGRRKKATALGSEVTFSIPTMTSDPKSKGAIPSSLGLTGFALKAHPDLS